MIWRTDGVAMTPTKPAPADCRHVWRHGYSSAKRSAHRIPTTPHDSPRNLTDSSLLSPGPRAISMPCVASFFSASRSDPALS